MIGYSSTVMCYPFAVVIVNVTVVATYDHLVFCRLDCSRVEMFIT